MTATVDELIAAERLPASYAATVERWWRPLARLIAEWRSAAGCTLIVGINGAQGSGKSTLCRFLQESLLPECGISAVTVSLDNLYLTTAAREQVARDVHPLFRTRGVPGTHDVALGISILDDLAAGRTAHVPRFSKALDDRLPETEWAVHSGPVDAVLFEGWCVGARPQAKADLAHPVNDLEAQEDAEGLWRRHVNALLATSYADWFARIDRLIMLKPPSFDSVLHNRMLQEHKLRALTPDAPGIMDEDALRRFISHYERLTRHMFADLPGRADILFNLDARQDIVSGQPFAAPRAG